MRNICFAPLFLIASISFADRAPGVVYAGNKAEVTIVEFGDFQCPYCKRANEALKQVVATYGDKVRIVVRNSPLDFHQEAKPAAAAGLCADEREVRAARGGQYCAIIYNNRADGGDTQARISLRCHVDE